MTFSKYFKAVSLLISALVCFSSAAKVGKGKVTYRVGDSKLQKEGKDTWKDVSQGMKVGQHDVIRTELEAQVIITLPDGSTLNIDEGTLIELPELMSEDGVNKFAAEIKAGRVKFEIQKQTDSKSSVRLSTGTATAAIRGTSGVFGVGKHHKPYVSLSTGLVEFTVNGATYSVGGGQTAIPGPDGYQVVDLNASGNKEFLKDLEEMMGDSAISLDSIIKAAKEKDRQFTELLNSLKDSLQCNTSNLADTTYKTSVTLKAICKPGINVTMNSQMFASTGEEIQLVTGWAPGSEGEKKFPITCSLGKISVECGMLKTYYKPVVEDTAKTDSIPHKALVLTSSSVIDVCEKGLATVEGEFDPLDPSASLRVIIGNKASDNLLPFYPDGKFSYSIPVSDKQGNWNETKVTVEYQSNLYGKEVATAELSVNKSCPDVNLIAPVVVFSGSDSSKCEADLKVEKANGDIVLFKPIVDGAPMNETYFAKDGKISVNLTTGLHDYEFQATDLAGHKNAVHRQLGCYPRKDKFGIRFQGSSYERLRIPPNRPHGSTELYRTLHFSITGMSQNDPVYIKEIIISQKDKPDVVIKGSSMQTNTVDYQVTLPWGAITKINVEAKMKNGSIVKATKTYDIQVKPKSSEVK